MAISVIIAAYNAEPYLAETLSSVLGQTVRPQEVIVVDDGSTDRTAEVAEAFGAPVRVFRRTNQRQGAARNFGVEQATGDLIAFIDSDDLWEPRKLEIQLAAMADKQEADLCFTGYVNFRRVDGCDVFDVPWIGAEITSSNREFLLKPYFLPSCILMRRSTFLNLGKFRLNFKVCEDTDFFLRLHRSGGKFIACPEPLLKRRMHGSNVSSNVFTKYEEWNYIFKDQALPRLRGLERLRIQAEFHSFTEAELAYAQRVAGSPAAMKTMAKSLFLWPFGHTVRYKVFLHMVLTRVGLLRSKAKQNLAG